LWGLLSILSLYECKITQKSAMVQDFEENIEVFYKIFGGLAKKAYLCTAFSESTREKCFV